MREVSLIFYYCIPVVARNVRERANGHDEAIQDDRDDKKDWIASSSPKRRVLATTEL